MSRAPNIRNTELYRRNDFHNPLFNALTVEFDKAFTERELTDEYILDHFYVDQRSDQGITNERIFSLLKSKPHQIEKAEHLVAKFDAYPGMVYILLGKKGTGKTITLKYFVKTLVHDAIEQHRTKMAVIYLDLRAKKTDKDFLTGLPSTLMEELFFAIKRNVPTLAKYLEEPEYVQKLDSSYTFFSKEALFTRILDNKAEALEFLFNFSSNSGYEIYLIIDNVDDFPVASISSIVDKCIDLKNKYNIRCILALRDYWTPQSLKIDYTVICSCYLSKADIYTIVMKRLNTIPVEKATQKLFLLYGTKPFTLGPEDLMDTFRKITKTLTEDKELHEELYQLTNFNTREHLRNIYHFFHSPYLYTRPIFIKTLIDKIKELDPDFKVEPLRKSRWFDFLECFMAIHCLCYDIKDSKIFNIFFHEYQYDQGHNYQNTLLFIRILQSLPQTTMAVNKEQLINRLASIGYAPLAIRDAIHHLLEEALIESPDGMEEVDVTDLFISPKGLFYIGRIIYEYAYLQYVCDAVPMSGKYQTDILDKFGNEDIPLERGNLMVKIESVHNFVNFVEQEENQEYRYCPPKYREILNQIIDGQKTSQKMREDTEYTVGRMTTGPWPSKKKLLKMERVTVVD